MNIEDFITKEILEDCVNNEKPFFKKIIINKKMFLIIKYQFLPKYDVKVCDEFGRRVDAWYNNLSWFDTFDILRELFYNEK